MEVYPLEYWQNEKTKDLVAYSHNNKNFKIDIIFPKYNNFYVAFLFENSGLKIFKTLEEAKQGCQDYYKDFILSQIQQMEMEELE